jgi:hypothetical protein
METRNIKVSLFKAKEWYISNNPILKELALQAFTEKELRKPIFSEIILVVGSVEVPKDEGILRTLAEFYKKPGDKFYPDQDKYFIGKNSYDGWTVIKHSSVLYPGIAYFLREKDAKEALEIFKEELGIK